MDRAENRGLRRRRVLLYGGLSTLACLAVLFGWLSWIMFAPVDVVGGDGVSAAPSDRRLPEPNPQEVSSQHLADVGEPLWEVVDETSIIELPPYATEWSVAGRALVRTSNAASAALAWRVGDRLTLPLPQLGETYRPVIEAIDDGVGSRAALGWIVGEDGHRWRYVVTIGPTSLFAYVDTPGGPYELVAGPQYGWLLPSSSMFAGWDFTKPDYVLPESANPDDELQF